MEVLAEEWIQRVIDFLFLKIMKNFVEFLAWLRIAASPSIAGCLLGGFSYVYFTSPLNIGMAVALSCAGLVLGILWANKVRKRRSAVDFISEVNRSRDADQKA